METKIATLIKDCSEHFWREAKLYRVSPPVEYRISYSDNDSPAKLAQYVIVSSTDVPFSGPETYIFPSDAEGNVLNWTELEGSYRGGLDIEKALSYAGFEIAGGDNGKN
jgi:hypothetical protein